MPHTLLRSVVYRSFVTCDDPKGIIECGTIRKSKSDPQKMEGKIEKPQRISKNLNKYNSDSSSSNTRASEKEIEGTLQEERNSSSLQLMEVSRGAQKLNRVIDSWSYGGSFEGQSKDIAEDLLKGALDLQESLVVLGKLQEASQYMTKIKKKEKEKDEIGVVRSDSGQLRQNGQAGFQNPNPFGKGSSRDCYDELRDVIRDSFAKQNLFPNNPYQEKACFDKRRTDASQDFPSTSSSTSTLAYSHDFSSSDGSYSLKGVPEEKPKRSNLIAKLMGLEEVSSKKTVQSFSQENLMREKKIIASQSKPVFDIDLRHMPKSRKPQSFIQKTEREKMTLDEIIEIMQFKGVLNSRNRHQNSNSHRDETFRKDSPPIVIMKPWKPDQEIEELHENRKWKTKQEIPSIMMESRGRALDSIETRRKQLVDEKLARKMSLEKGPAIKKVILAKQVDKEAKIWEKDMSHKVKNSVVSRAKQEKKATVEKKVDKIQKISLNRDRGSEPKTVEQSKQRNLESKSNTTREKISQPRSGNKSSEAKKSKKLVKKSSPSKVEKIQPKDDAISINPSCETGLDQTYTLLHSEEELDAVDLLVKENSDNKSVFNSTKEERNNVLLKNTPFIDNTNTILSMHMHEYETTDSKLLSDCKTELLNQENHRQISNVNSFLQNVLARSRLETEVYDGIEYLKKYTTAGNGGAAGVNRVPTDAVSGVVEMDLGWLGGGWGTGWREGYTWNEIDQIVGYINKLVLGQLIQEVITGFSCLVF